jgi:NhaP-type Na+/H+ or K+/H+ antiporter
MAESMLLGLAGIVVLGIAAEWLAWRIQLPTIFVLLLFGVIAGPVTGLFNPDRLFGDLLMPLVSLCVAVILFEGGLTLQLRELRAVGRVAWLLITVGVAITWVLASVAASVFLGFDARLAALLGAILVVTGPTVILPLLAYVRPRGRVASILKWEGITVDPVGATFAVLVFEALYVHADQEATLFVATGVLRTIVIGCALGGAGVTFLVVLLRKHWIPDHLHSPVALAVVLGTFALSNAIQHESGLLTVTLLGAMLANQRYVNIRHVVEFKENLRVLLLSSLFIILAARLDLDRLMRLGPGSALFLAALILVVRPASVLACTLRSGLSWRERAYLAYMAPRGVVAAAVTSVFALRLTENGVAQAEELVPVTFFVIAGLVALYALTARPVTRMLGLALPDPNGVAIVGAHRLGRTIGKALHDEGFPVTVIDRNWGNISAARMDGLSAYHGDVLSDTALHEMDLSEMGKLIAVTANDEVNSLAALHFSERFGKTAVYQLAVEGPATPGSDVKEPAPHLRGQILFGKDVGHDTLARRIREGDTLKATKISDKFTFEAFRQEYGDSAIPMFIVGSRGGLRIITAGSEITPQAGDKIIALVDDKPEVS